MGQRTPSNCVPQLWILQTTAGVRNVAFWSVSFDWSEYLQTVLLDYGFEQAAVRKAVEISEAQYHTALQLLLSGQVK